MENPWLEITKSGKFILESDISIIEEFNNKNKKNSKVQIKTDLFPEPFVGNINAPIVLLSLNPGFSRADYKFYSTPPAKQIWVNNIQHKQNEYPFFLIDPIFNKSRNGFDWWTERLKDLIYVYGAKKLSQALLCIEFFPYHSEKYKDIGKILDSQKYAFYLVKEAMQRKAIIIITRSKNKWFDQVEGLDSYNNLHFLNSSQSIYITSNNCPTGFKKIIDVLESKV
ncbi:hypothetical protein BMS3Abin03_02056 [bacterium BMS3Abin03]|nr:hypothetical protein BMS3Abin03_02056 [bacterium BMS3Abin03]